MDLILKTLTMTRNLILYQKCFYKFYVNYANCIPTTVTCLSLQYVMTQAETTGFFFVRSNTSFQNKISQIMCDTWLLHTTARTSEVNNDTCKVARLCRYVYHTFTSISSVGEEMIFSYYRSVSKSEFYDSLRCTT